MRGWTEPSFEEIDMNAEIGGYQGDPPPFVEPNEQESQDEIPTHAEPH